MSTFTERIIEQANEEIERLSQEAAELHRQVAEISAKLAINVNARDEAKAVIAALNSSGKGSTLHERVPITVELDDGAQPRDYSQRGAGPENGVPPTTEPQSASEALAAVPPPTNGHATRQSPTRITLEEVRDFVRTLDGQWSSLVVRERFGIAGSTAKKYLDALVKRDPPVLKQHGTTGRYVRYEYIPPSEAEHTPTHKPRTETEGHRKADVRKSSSSSVAIARGITVPHTGKMKGRSGKPGFDKKRAEQGHRIKRGRNGS